MTLSIYLLCSTILWVLFCEARSSNLKVIRNSADRLWRHGSSSLNRSAVIQAGSLYRESYERSNFTDISSFWQFCYTNLVAGRYDQLPDFNVYHDVLQRELSYSISSNNEFGITTLPQMIAMTAFDAHDLLRITSSWSSSFKQSAMIESNEKKKLKKTIIPEQLESSPRFSDRYAISASHHLSLNESTLSNDDIRVGLFTCHFGHHPVGHHFRVLTAHKVGRNLTLICISTKNDQSTHYQRNIEGCDEVLDLSQHVDSSSYNVAKRIQTLKLDVLITGDGWDLCHRMDVLSFHPAPIQVSYFGFLSTLGASYIDGLFVDDSILHESGTSLKNASTNLFSDRHSNSLVGLGNVSEPHLPNMVVDGYFASHKEEFVEKAALIHPTSFFGNSYSLLFPHFWDSWCFVGSFFSRSHILNAPILSHRYLRQSTPALMYSIGHSQSSSVYSSISSYYSSFISNISSFSAQPYVDDRERRASVEYDDSDITVNVAVDPSWPTSHFESVSNLDAFDSIYLDRESRKSAIPFSFCSFSQLFKLNSEIIHTWTRILLQTGPHSHLFLPLSPPLAAVGFLETVVTHARTLLVPNHPIFFTSSEQDREVLIASLLKRIHFLEPFDFDHHLTIKSKLCGLGLDTPFYNGHVSTMDLLFSGVPVVSYARPNASFAGRAAHALLRAAYPDEDPLLFTEESLEHLMHDDASKESPGRYDSEYLKMNHYKRLGQLTSSFAVYSLEEYERVAVSVWAAYQRLYRLLVVSGDFEETAEGEDYFRFFNGNISDPSDGFSGLREAYGTSRTSAAKAPLLDLTDSLGPEMLRLLRRPFPPAVPVFDGFRWSSEFWTVIRDFVQDTKRFNSFVNASIA